MPERPICKLCGKRLVELRYGRKRSYRSKCAVCRRPYKYNVTSYYKSKLKKENDLVCSNCGFKAQHQCQLEVDHIDGDATNSDLTNLQVLCANCHNLKTHTNKDYLSRKERGLDTGPLYYDI